MGLICISRKRFSVNRCACCTPLSMASLRCHSIVNDATVPLHSHGHQMQSMLLQGLLIALGIITVSSREGRRKVFSEHVPVSVAEEKNQMVKVSSLNHFHVSSACCSSVDVLYFHL